MILEFFLATSVPLAFLLIFLEKSQRTLVTFLMWGFCAGAIVFYINEAISAGLAGSIITMRVTVAPVVEELFKALPLFILAFLGKGQRKDLLALALASGFGFSMLENYSYLMGAELSGISGVVYAFTRAVTTSLMHGSTTAIVGYGIFLTGGIHRKALPALLFGLYSIAITIHALFNLYVSYTAQGRAVGAVIPLFLFVALMFLYNFDLIEESNREKRS